jgi:hypothetical protein
MQKTNEKILGVGFVYKSGVQAGRPSYVLNDWLSGHAVI